MSRQEGLIQRRNVQTSIAAARSEDTTRLEPDIADKKRLGDDGQDVDADSKETRLTLMEEVLLLGLKDKEVNPNPWASAHRGKLGQLGMTKYRKGPLRTAKDPQRTAKDHKGPTKDPQRTAKEHYGLSCRKLAPIELNGALYSSPRQDFSHAAGLS